MNVGEGPNGCPAEFKPASHGNEAQGESRIVSKSGVRSGEVFHQVGAAITVTIQRVQRGVVIPREMKRLPFREAQRRLRTALGHPEHGCLPDWADVVAQRIGSQGEVEHGNLSA